jgi:hypothetical protein
LGKEQLRKKQWSLTFYFYKLEKSILLMEEMVRGARKLTGDNLKIVWVELSTLS